METHRRHPCRSHLALLLVYQGLAWRQRGRGTVSLPGLLRRTGCPSAHTSSRLSGWVHPLRSECCHSSESQIQNNVQIETKGPHTKTVSTLAYG